MKAFIHFKNISLAVLLLSSLQVFAQPDLLVIDSMAPSPHIFNGDGQENSLFLQINNDGNLDTVGGVTLTFSYDMFVDPSFQFVNNVISSDWNCPNFNITLTCTSVANIPAFGVLFLNVPVIVDPGNFSFTPAFNVLVTDVNGDETNLSDNFTSFNIDYVAGGGTDFQLNVTPPGDPIVFPTGGGTATLLYQVTNNGPFAEGDQTTVTFNLNPGIEPASAFSSNPSWSCNSVTSQIICDFFDSYSVGLTTTIELTLTSPFVDSSITNAVQASISNALGDSNPGNETITTNIDFVSGGAVDLEIVKTISSGFPTSVAPGDPLNFDLTVTNLSGVDATNVSVFDDILSADLMFDSVNSSPECVQSTSIQCDLTTLAAGNSVTFTIATTVNVSAQPGLKTNTAFVTSLEPDSDTNNNSSDQAFTVAVGGSPEIEVIKSVVGNLTQVVQGTLIDYIIEVNNTGVGNALNVDLTDNLPLGVTYQSHLDLGPNFTCTYAAPTLSCNAPSLPNTVNADGVQVTVLVDGAISSFVNNTAVSGYVDGNSINNSSSASFNIIAPTADLDLTMIADSINYNVGDIINLNLTLHNPFGSTGAPPNTTVSTTLPNEVIFSSAQVSNDPGWQCVHDGAFTGGVITCDSQGNPVAIGTNTFIDIVAVANSAGTTLTPFATVTSDFDPNPSNDTANTTFQIFPVDADLSIVFTSVSGIYNQGDTIFYDIQVANPMISTASPSDVNVNITLPVEVVFTNADVTAAPGWSCTHDGSVTGGQINCDLGGAPFVSNSVDDFSIEVLANSPATNAFVSAGITSVADPFTSNNLTNQSDVINGLVTDFSIVKTVSATNFAVGDTFTYYLTVSNDLASTGGPNDVVINDQLPPEVSYVSYIVGSNMGTTVVCTHDGANTGGLFSCNTNGSPFAVGEVVTIDLNVSAASSSATVNNSATVATSTDPNGVGLNNISAAPTVVVSGPLTTTITATKSASISGVGVSNVSYGQPFEYVLQVDNTGANDAINVHVTDNLPVDVSFVSVDAVDWTCLPIGVPIRTSNGGGETVDCTLNAPLAPATNSQITVNVVATTNTAVSSITNQMEAVGDNTGTLVISNVAVNLLNAMADLTLSQTPNPVDLNSAVDFNLNFSNTGTVPLNGVQIVSILPQDFIYNGFSAGQGVSCALNAGTVSCISTNPLPINSAVNVTLNLTTPAALVANQNYNLQVSANANELAAPINRTLGAVFLTSDFTVNMTSDLNEVAEGESFVHTLNIRNTGTLDLISVEAYIAFPDYGQLMGVQSSDMNCTVNSNIVQCVNINNLLPTDNNTVDLTFQVVGFNGQFGTSASINGDGVDKSTSTTTQINGTNEFSNDLSLVKSTSVSQVGQQGAYSYIFDVMNAGSEDQSGFSLTDNLPSGVIFQTASGANWTCTGNTSINCQFNGVLIAGSQTQLVMDVIAPAQTGLVTNTANITAVDENLANNQSSASLEVVAGTGGGVAVADLAVQVSTDVVDVINTEQVTWSIEVTNLGPDVAENVHIENQFPMGFVADEVLVTGGVTCVMLSTSLACDVASMAVNQAIQINLIGGFNSGFEGQLMNVVDVSSDAIDPDLSNNQSQAQINVTTVEDLTVDLALELLTEPQNIRQGDVFELKFKTKNFGPNRAIEPTINATLSGLISQIQIVNSGQWACQSTNASLSCQYPGNYLVGVEQMIVLNVVTERIEQTSQALLFNAVIESTAMEINPGNNMIGFTGEVSSTPSADDIYNLFAEAVGPGASDTVMRTIQNVSSYCARRYFMAIEGLCEEMIAGARPENRDDIINLMEEITPNEVTGQSTSAHEMMASQFSNIGSRLSELRGGGGSGFSVAGLNGRYGNESIPIGMLAYLNQSEDEKPAVSNINDFVSPWGLFVNGSISMGERDATGRELGFDFDTYGLTAGVDYRFSPTKVAGIALGYANFDSKIEGEAEMKSTGFTLTGYGSFYIKDNFYVDTRISYGNPDFEQKRRINFQLDDIAIDRVASGKTDASQYSVAMSMGYHFNKNSWNITPNASVQYVRTSIDGFQETGAGGFNFLFNDQEIKSMVWSVGASVSKAISLKNGVISPQFDFNFNRETEDDGGLIEARFLSAPDDEIFYIDTDDPDRTYGSAGIGLVFIGANGKQAYINYRSIFGLEGFTRGTINIGARFEF